MPEYTIHHDRHKQRLFFLDGVNNGDREGARGEGRNEGERQRKVPHCEGAERCTNLRYRLLALQGGEADIDSAAAF